MNVNCPRVSTSHVIAKWIVVGYMVFAGPHYTDEELVIQIAHQERQHTVASRFDIASAFPKYLMEDTSRDSRLKVINSKP